MFGEPGALYGCCVSLRLAVPLAVLGFAWLCLVGQMCAWLGKHVHVCACSSFLNSVKLVILYMLMHVLTLMIFSTHHVDWSYLNNTGMEQTC